MQSFLYVLGAIVFAGTRFCVAQSTPYPLPDSFLSTTTILNHSSYVDTFDEPQWYLDNVPFVDFPDPTIQEIYYYRTSVLKRHLTFTHPGHGWVFTEFIQPVPWASKFQSIPDSAAHQILEGRWLRDPSYVKDTIQHYTRGGLEKLAGITYTHYIHDAILEFAESNGDLEFLTSQLDGMINTYYLWNSTRDNSTGLYHRTPLLDAQEFSLPGYVVGGPGGGAVQQWNSFQNNYSMIWLGPETYRPNFNAYMVAGARAISTVAALAGNNSLANTWNSTANALYSHMQSTLWSSELQFWIDVIQGTNMSVVGRQLIGLFPYRFDVGTESQYLPGIEASLNQDIFVTDFGPTTLEQTSPYFTAGKNLSYCCLWNGQSWPFSTSVYLGTLARIARANLSSIATPEFFQDALSTYARTQYDNGAPAIYESHYPESPLWSGHTTNHSEHYLHSTYIDNIFTNLLGIVPSLSNNLTMSPLIPSNWTSFVVENLPYHGTLLSILWDQNGTAYYNWTHTQGLTIYSNGSLLYQQADLSPFSITLPNATNQSLAYLSSAQRYVNILANPNTYVSPQSLPFANATDTFFASGNNLQQADSAAKANDGLLFYDNPPDNFYSNNQTYEPSSWLNFTLPRARTFSSVTIAVYDDSARNGSAACPGALYVYVSNTTTPGNASYTTTPGMHFTAGRYLNTSTNASSQDTLVSQQTPWSTCQGNARNTLNFNTSVTADTISLYLVNALHYCVAIPEVEIWVPANTGPRYEAEDGLIGFEIGATGMGVNGTVEGNGVRLNHSGILEWADVRTQSRSGSAGLANVTVIGYGGSLTLGLNYLSNTSITLPSSSSGSRSTQVSMLAGGNVVTLYQTGNSSVWIDAIVVG